MGEIVNGTQINETHANVKRSRSRFPLKQIVLDTHRFGEYHPHLAFDSVTSDSLPYRSRHNARSYTLKAPLMQDIQMHKDYFQVPLRAILPFQGDRIVTNPTIGDDVPDDVYTYVPSFVDYVGDFTSSIFNVAKNADLTTPSGLRTAACYTFKYLVALEAVFSAGSLLASLGCSLNKAVRITDNTGAHIFFTDGRAHRIDEFFDAFVRWFKLGLSSQFIVNIDGVSYRVVDNIGVETVSTTNDISWHEFLMRIRDTADWDIDTMSFSPITDWQDFFDDVDIYVDGLGFGIDIARLWAYQLCCAEFYTNDKVDYIYSAELFREYINSLCVASGLVPESQRYFSWNGSSLPYDYLSSHVFMRVVDLFTLGEVNVLIPRLQYYLTLFGYRRSLRFKDYFTGSRTRPLAVGDTNIPVVNQNVSVVDVSRSIQVQRFLNAVNATGRKFEEYLKGIFGVAPSPDHHNPLFLSHTSDSIFAAEVENTGEAQQTQQNSVTAVFRGNGNQFVFKVDISEPSIIIGVTSYDIERCYPYGMDRTFQTKDRFDMFLPQLQYVGDQPIYRCELDESIGSPLSAFGYQFRDMDRKQLVNRAHGGFVTGSLPGYSFVYRRSRLSENNISPDFIRSRNDELDQFYVSLTGYSLGTYFHFIVESINEIDASRPMAVNPQILG